MGINALPLSQRRQKKFRDTARGMTADFILGYTKLDLCGMSNKLFPPNFPSIRVSLSGSLLIEPLSQCL